MPTKTLFKREGMRIIGALMALFLIFSLSPASFAMTMTGVEGHWAEPAVEKLWQQGIVAGDNGDFRPESVITRAEFAAMLNRAFGYPAMDMPTGGLHQFSDVKEGKWYRQDLSTALALGYMKGYGGNLFGPGEGVTREQAAHIIYTILRMEKPEEAASFSDSASISSWAKDGVSALQAKGYLQGFGGAVAPKAFLTRADAAQLVSNVWGQGFDQSKDLEGKTVENVTIRRAGVTLQKGVVKGDLYITEGVMDGLIILKDLVITGNLIIAGGADIRAENISVSGKILIDKPSIAGGKGVAFKYAGNSANAVVYNGHIHSLIIGQDHITVEVDSDKGGVAFKLTEAPSPQRLDIQLGARVDQAQISRPTDIRGEGTVGSLIIDKNGKGTVVDSSLKVDKLVNENKTGSKSSGPRAYTVAYHANGGTGTIGYDTLSYGHGYTVKDSIGFTKSNHVFTGWNTHADGSGTAYAVGAEFPVHGNITLYAQWDRVSCTITYEGNGGTGSAGTPQTIPYGTTHGALANNGVSGNPHFSRDGYNFVRWNTAADGSGTSYAPGASITNVQEDITLYAQWKGVNRTIFYVGNGGIPGSAYQYTNGHENGTVHTVLELGYNNMPDYTNLGYNFIGWRTTADASGDLYEPGKEVVITADTTFYAQWKPVD